ncbi:MAG TPA: hypothetical protein VMR46_03745 [Candidatus Paceibacterota bacterium]|nr:hypothetical protein [Candidatus Paceibacterota bacterium]
MTILHTVWRWVKWPLAILVVAYIALVIYRLPAVGEKQRTADAVAHIQAQKITMADVMGTNLPPQPYEPENDATVAGLDKNNNGIRDDVELAIFAKYPHSAKIRAAELQYALADQLILTQVFNADTWIAVAEQQSRAYACVGESIPTKDLATLISRTKEVDDLVFNTQIRNSAKDQSYSFTTSYALPDTDLCDIDLNSLSN